MKEKETRATTMTEAVPINEENDIKVVVKITFPFGGTPKDEKAVAKVKAHMKKAMVDLSHLDQVELPLPDKKA